MIDRVYDLARGVHDQTTMRNYIVLPLIVTTVVLGCAGGERARRPKAQACTNPAPSDADVRQLRDYLADGRRSLPDLPPVYREHMEMRLDFLEQALDNFDRARGVASWCTKKGAFLPIGGVSVGGAAARVSPHMAALVAIGAVAVYLMTTSATPPAELGREWGDVVGAMDSIGRLVETMERYEQARDTTLTASRVSPIPRRQCQRHYVECLGSRMGNMRGSQFGETQCLTCRKICGREATGWPDKSWDGKSCVWW